MKLVKKKKAGPPPAEPDILIESWSPVCQAQAFVEDDGSSVHFYVWFYPGEEYAQMRSCWVCNRSAAPEELDMEGMEQGAAPLMPASFTDHPETGMKLERKKLSIVWFEEGDAAALLSGDELLAVIPGWAGDGFHGYARHARGQGPLAWELAPAEAVLRKRVDRSAAYWEELGGDYWGALQNMHLVALEGFFGPQEKYFAIDGGNFPPKALVTGRRDGVRYGVTAGVCALVQPMVEQSYQEKAKDYRRVELGFACAEGAMDEEAYMKMLSYVSGQTQLPWGEVAWLGHGHTVPCNAVKGFEAVLLLNASELPELPGPSYDSFMGERVNLLWMAPLTAEEYREAQDGGLESMMGEYAGKADRLIVFDGAPKFGRKE